MPNIKLLFDFDKLIIKHKSLVNKYFNDNYLEELDFYNKYYNEHKYIYNKQYIENKQYLKNSNKIINWKNILNNTVKNNIYVYNPVTTGYYNLYQLYKDDILISNLDKNTEIRIAEISVLPTMFEIMHNNNKIDIDVYLTKDNYMNLDEKEWIKTIDIYRKKISENIYYNKKINKKYNILIINLKKKIKQSINNCENNYINYAKTDVLEYVKNEIKMLKYLEKDGTCYIYFYSIITNDLLKLYLSLCKKFETIDFLIAKYRINHGKLGGLWLKCNNYKCKSKNTLKDFKSNIEKFYLKYYDEKQKWYLEYEKYLELYFSKNKDYIKIKNDIMQLQINTCKQFIEEYKIQVKPQWRSFLYGKFYVKEIFEQINYRTLPSTEYNNIFRTLSNNNNNERYGYLPYGVLDKKSINCHDGQRKLLFSEIEFYSLIREKYDLNNILVVYAGSADGTHEPIIFNLFPELDFYLCDPNRFLINHPLINNKERVRINNDYYTDETWHDVVIFNKKKKDIVFICDIREDTGEQDILNNMIQQQLWTVQLNSVAYMLKFRLPYLIEEKFKKLNINYKLPDKIKINKKILDSPNKSIYDFLYLKGDIYFQIYSPLMSSETRLIHVKNNKKEEFEAKKYSIDTYDGNLYYFNMIDRSKKYEYKDSRLMKYHLLGYDDGYDSVNEYYIINKYLGDSANNSDIIKKIYNVNNEIIHYCHKDIILCPLYTLFKDPKEFKINYKYVKNIELKKSKIRSRLNRLKRVYILLLFSLKNQYYYFTKGHILSDNEYQKQLERIKEKYKLLNKYMETFINNEFIKKNIKYLLIKDIISKADELYNKLIKTENNDNNINSLNRQYLDMFANIYKKI
jgi:hypothetical protein